jgi:phosphoglucosamine mutase
MVSEWDIARELDAIRRYPILRKSFPSAAAQATLSALGAANPTDGIRIADEDGWYLIRASGTEPKIRITAEGKTPKKAKAMMEQATKRIKEGKTA